MLEREQAYPRARDLPERGLLRSGAGKHEEGAGCLHICPCPHGGQQLLFSRKAASIERDRRVRQLITRERGGATGAPERLKRVRIYSERRHLDVLHARRFEILAHRLGRDEHQLYPAGDRPDIASREGRGPAAGRRIITQARGDDARQVCMKEPDERDVQLPGGTARNPRRTVCAADLDHVGPLVAGNPPELADAREHTIGGLEWNARSRYPIDPHAIRGADARLCIRHDDHLLQFRMGSNVAGLLVEISANAAAVRAVVLADIQH